MNPLEQLRKEFEDHIKSGGVNSGTTRLLLCVLEGQAGQISTLTQIAQEQTALIGRLVDLMGGPDER